MPDTLTLRPGALRLADLRRMMLGEIAVTLSPECWAGVDAAAAAVARIAGGERPVYGVNTGFGSLARTRIPADRLSDLQHRLVLSHSAGVGPALPDPVVRLVLLLKINALARGHSGVRRVVIETLLDLLNAGVLPCIPAQGSVGASGDLAPLAHLAAVLIGAGEARVDGRVVDGGEALKRAGRAPLALAAKEGLALLNGTQVSTALLAAGLFAALDVFAAALVAGALSVDAVLGSDVPFDPRLHRLRGHAGEAAVAETLAALLEGSEIRRSHLECDRVQDPYSVRCQPQVMGSCLDLLTFAAGVAEREANAVTDNPLVFAESGEVLSGGNFHAEPVAHAADLVALALAEIAALSERRIALLTDAHMSGLPAFLVSNPGLNSGFMSAQITAAALAAEVKARAHPVSIESLPTTANQEDHVSMATFAARRLAEMSENAATVAAIELLAAAQGVDLRRPHATAPALRPAMEAIRARVPHLDEDRVMAPDIRAIRELVLSGWFRETMGLAALAGL